MTERGPEEGNATEIDRERLDEPTHTAAGGDVPEEEWDDTPRGRGRALPALGIALGVVLAVLITYSLLRIAGEEHYQSCVSAVNAKYGSATDNLTRLVRTSAVGQCSRSPF
jgi:hypothetical protein